MNATPKNLDFFKSRYIAMIGDTPYQHLANLMFSLPISFRFLFSLCRKTQIERTCFDKSERCEVVRGQHEQPGRREARAHLQARPVLGEDSEPAFRDRRASHSSLHPKCDRGRGGARRRARNPSVSQRSLSWKVREGYRDGCAVVQ